MRIRVLIRLMDLAQHRAWSSKKQNAVFTTAVKGLDIHMFLAAQDAGTRSHCRRLYGCRKGLWLGVGFCLSPAQADCNLTLDTLR